MLWLAAAATARAHDPGLSSLELVMRPNAIDLRLSLSPRDAEVAVSGVADRQRSSPPALLSPRLGTFASDAIELRVDGRRLEGVVQAIVREDDTTVYVKLTYPRVFGSRLTVRSRVAEKLARGHRELLTVRDADGAVMIERMLGGSAEHAVTELDVSAGRLETARQFFTLGVEHILAGYDHLLFLAGLLLGVHRARSVLGTATAFTIGHSLTLACAVLGVVHVPSSVVEPLIGASIAYVGVENLLRAKGDARWMTGVAFGLIHGLGFAGALRELGVGTHSLSIGLPLGSFNIGVESGQVAVALLVWPVMRHLRTRPAVGAMVMPACSLIVALSGAYLLVVRLEGIYTP